MATLAEMMFQAQSASAQTPSGMADAFAKGAQIAQQAQNLQVEKQKLQQAKQTAELAKFEKVGQWFETLNKMEPGPAREAFKKDFIPNGINALGMTEQFNPISMKMMLGDANLANYMTDKVRKGEWTMQQLTAAIADPAALGKLMPEASRFGSEQLFKDTVSGYSGDLNKAAEFAASEEGKAARAAQMAGSKDNQRGITNQGDLRREITGHPVTKGTLAMAESYDKIRTSFGGKPSPAGDISGVFAYMKMLDPGSTVREGEQAQARDAQGVPERILNMYNRLVTGETLTPEQRKDFTNRATKLYREQYNRQQGVNAQYEEIARANGINPQLVFAGTRFTPPADGFAPSSEQRARFKNLPAGEQERVINGLAEKYKLTPADVRKGLQ